MRRIEAVAAMIPYMTSPGNHGKIIIKVFIKFEIYSVFYRRCSSAMCNELKLYIKYIYILIIIF